LVTGRPTPPGGVPPAQYVESSQASSDAPMSTSTGLTLPCTRCLCLTQTRGTNHSEQAHGILEGHVLQLSDTRNELCDNSNEPYVRLERFHDLVHGEPRELLAIKHGCCKDLASGAMLSRRKSPFPSKDDSHRIRAWVSYSQKRVSYTPQPRQDSLGNSGDPNARVAFAGENKDGIDGHRH